MAPARSARSWEALSPCAEMKMIGSLLPDACRASCSSKPVMPRIRTSTIRQLQESLHADLRNSVPEANAWFSKPTDRSNRLNANRTDASSSTTHMVGLLFVPSLSFAESVAMPENRSRAGAEQLHLGIVHVLLLQTLSALHKVSMNPESDHQGSRYPTDLKPESMPTCTALPKPDLIEVAGFHTNLTDGPEAFENASVWARVCKMAMKPISAPGCMASPAIVRSVSAVARSRMSYSTALFWYAIAATTCGTVKTTWNTPLAAAQFAGPQATGHAPATDTLGNGDCGNC